MLPFQFIHKVIKSFQNMYLNFIVIMLTLSMCVNCVYMRDNRDLQIIDTQNTGRVENIALVKRDLNGRIIPKPVATREQTVVVVPNAGNALPYRNVPATYGTSVNRGTTILVVPDNNYNNGVIANPYAVPSNRL